MGARRRRSARGRPPNRPIRCARQRMTVSVTFVGGFSPGHNTDPESERESAGPLPVTALYATFKIIHNQMQICGDGKESARAY